MEKQSPDDIMSTSYGEERYNSKLIREVERHPVIYNHKLTEYTKRDIVDAAWNEIAAAMGDDAITCKEKWRNLRTVFVRKLKPPGPGVVRRKRYYLGEAMSFLMPFVKINKSADTTESIGLPSDESEADTNNACFEEPSRDQYDEHDDQEVVFSTPATYSSNATVASNNQQNSIAESNAEWPCQPEPEPKHATVKRESKDFAETSEEDYETKRRRCNSTDESRRYFLMSLLPDVQKLSANQMKYFRRKMLDALEEAESYPEHAPRSSLHNGHNSNREGNGGAGPYFSFVPKQED